MATRKTVSKKRAGARTKSAASSWTIRGVSEETKTAATQAAKEKGVPVGQWVDDALSNAAKSDPGAQIMSSLQDLAHRAEPTFEELRTRTDETLEKWRAGLAEHFGHALENIQRLQQQLLGQEESKATPAAATDEPAAKAAPKKAARSTKSGKKPRAAKKAAGGRAKKGSTGAKKTT